MKKYSKRIVFTLVVIVSLTFLILPQVASSQNSNDNPFKALDALRAERVGKALDLSTAKFSADNKDLINDKKNKENAMLQSPENRYIVKFFDNVSLDMIYNIVSNYKYNIIGDSSQRLFMINITNKDEFDQVTQGLLEYSEEDKKEKAHMVPNDQYYNQQWSLGAVNLPKGWDINTGSNTVYVAVIDSGVYRGHPDFVNTDIRKGYDLIFNGIVDWDSTGHGTKVTGVIAASTNNGSGIAGVDWNVAIVPYRVTYSDGTIYTSNTITAIRAAADAGCDVINISLGGGYNSVENTAIQYALSKGCIVVASAGNDGSLTYLYPASFSGVISVGSVNNNLAHSTFSQYNDQVDCVAPGENVLSTTYWLESGGEAQYNYNYGHVDGTSFSAPIVSGIAALCLSSNPYITPTDFNNALKVTCKDLGAEGKDNYYGYGLINAEQILKYFNTPLSPQNFKVNLVGDLCTELSWTPVNVSRQDGYLYGTSPSGYKLEMKLSSEDNWISMNIPISSSTYTFNNLINNNTYNFRISTVNEKGFSSPYSIVLSSTPLDKTVPLIPMGLKATVGNKNISLTWSANTEKDLGGYELAYQKNSTTTWTTLQLGADSTGTTIEGLEPSTLYRFKIRARDHENNWSAFSSEISAIAKDMPVSAFPGNTVLIGNKAFSMDYFFDTPLNSEIVSALMAGGDIYFDLGTGNDFRDAWTRAPITAAQIASLKNIVYLNYDGTKVTYPGIYGIVPSIQTTYLPDVSKVLAYATVLQP